MQVTDINRLHISTPYDEDIDCVLYCPSNNNSGTILRPGSVMILYPKDGHRSMCNGFKACKVKKIVGKLIIRVYGHNEQYSNTEL